MGLNRNEDLRRSRIQTPNPFYKKTGSGEQNIHRFSHLQIRKIEIYNKDPPASGPLRGTAGREFFEFF
jgi:hypothetical protein